MQCGCHALTYFAHAQLAKHLNQCGARSRSALITFTSPTVLPEFAVADASAVAADAVVAAAVVSTPSVSVSYGKIITQSVARNSENLM